MILQTNTGLYLLGGLSALLAFFAPIHTILLVIAAFVTADCLTAILKAIKKEKNEQYCKELTGWQRFKCKIKTIKSSKLRRTALKMFLYLMIPMLIFSAEIALFKQSIYATNVAAFWLIFAEFLSIAENCDFALGTTLFTSIVKKVRKMFEDILIKKIENPKIEKK